MRKVEVHIEIAASPERVIRAFTDPEMLRGWWGVERAFIEPREGGTFLVVWGVSDKGFQYVTSGVIKCYEPDRLIGIDNYTYLNPERPILGGLSLLVQARPSATGSSVYLCQDGYQENGHDEHWDWYYKVVEDAWPMVTRTLKTYLEQTHQ